MIINKIILVLILLIPSVAMANEAKQSFFDQRYRGWLWFEEKERLEDEDRQQSNIPTATEALDSIAERKQELEATRAVMIESAYRDDISKSDFLKMVMKYRELEEEMFKVSMKVGGAWPMTNLLNPELVDELENPVNLYGRRMKAEQDERRDTAALKELAKTTSLFVIRKGNCPYCPRLEEHLARFAQMYNFNVEAISPDDSNSHYFKTNHAPELIARLEVKHAPTVILVSDKNNHRYELARGVVSIEGLERTALLAAKLIEDDISELGEDS